MNYIRILLALLSVYFFVGCEDEPNSLGDNLIPDKDRIGVITINSTEQNFELKHSSYIDTLQLGSANRVLLGKYRNVNSSMLIKFLLNYSSSITTPLQNETLILHKSWIDLKPSYLIGEESAQFDFELKEILKNWSSLSFSKDSLNALLTGNSELSSNKLFTDSLISFDIDNQTVLKWMKSQINATDYQNYGLLFTPTAGTDKVLGFPALTSFSEDASLPRLSVIVEDPGNFIDTLSFLPSADIHVVNGNLPAIDGNNFIVQGSLPVHSNLWIDVSKVPSGVVINEAKLTLFEDTLGSVKGNIAADSVLVYLYEDSTVRKLDVNFAQGTLLRNSSGEFTGYITSYVQKWLEKPESNHGIQIRIGDNNRTVNLYSFYGSNALVQDKKPKLQITYTYHN